GGHVSRLDLCRGNRPKLRGKFPVQVALVAQEVEKLVVFDGPADGRAELVLDQLRFVLTDREKERLRLQMIVGMELEERSMQSVGSALDLHVYRGSPRQTLLRVEAVGDEIDGIDGLESGNKSGNVRQPGRVIGGSINARIVDAVTDAIGI